MNGNDTGTYRVLGRGNGVGATIRTIYNVARDVGLSDLSKADATKTEARKTSRAVKTMRDLVRLRQTRS